MSSSNQFGWDRKYTLKADDFHVKKLHVDIGVKWKDLARALEFSQASIDIIAKENFHCAKECCVEVLVLWLRRQGKDATAEKLVEALVEIGLKNVAERLPCKPSDPSKNLGARIHDLQEEVTKMSTRLKELLDEVSTLRARNKELENTGQQKGVCNGDDASKEVEQEARESRVSEILEKCKEDLETYVTQPLVVPEVRHDNLPTTAITVDVLKVISQHLEQQYNTALDIAPAACQCSEDLRKCFHDFAYRALQAENNEMNIKIKHLKKTLKEAPKDDKEEFENLKRLQKRRKDLVVKLEKWRRLLSPPMRYSNIRSKSDTTGKKLKQQNDETTKARRMTWYTYPMDKKEPLLLNSDEED